jgi:hypothetical protein
MDEELPDPIFDAFRAAAARGEMPTNLDTVGLREMSAELRARSVFTARGTSAAFISKLKEVIDQLAAGDIGIADGRVSLLETLRALGYTPEGGFPDAPAGSVPPAVAGSLQDLSSFRRLDLIVKTQLELMQGAGDQARGSTPERLEAAPAWELIRVIPRLEPRDWPTRWNIAGGTMVKGRMIALKGDPVWGELGSSANFDDALDTDHPPYAYNSGMGWREVSRREALALGVAGPEGQSIDAWLASRPRTISGQMPLPLPSLSMRDVDPEIAEEFVRSTKATRSARRPTTFDYSDLLREELAQADASYAKGGDR